MRGRFSPRETLTEKANTMATKDEAMEAVAAEKVEVHDALDAQNVVIDALKAEIAAGKVATAADLDMIKAAVSGIYTPSSPVVEPPVVVEAI